MTYYHVMTLWYLNTFEILVNYPNFGGGSIMILKLGSTGGMVRHLRKACAGLAVFIIFGRSLYRIGDDRLKTLTHQGL